MEKIERKHIADIGKLEKIFKNWEKWGEEYLLYKISKGISGTNFNSRFYSTYNELRNELELQVNGHCSFCDDFPVGTTSKEEIEHYFPKAIFPCLAYAWDNLFYICSKCNSNANSFTANNGFDFTLKSDLEEYNFSKIFYFDLGSGKVEVIESLLNKSSDLYNRAKLFLNRYGINNPKRNQARIYIFHDVKNFLMNPSDSRKRKDFAFRYVFDLAEKLYDIKNLYS